MNSRHGDLDRAVTRGGPTMEFVERSGVDNLASIRPCAYCGKPAAYRDLAGQPAHTTCAGESSEEKLHAKINTSESRAMTTNMTIDERYYRAGQHEQFNSDQRAEFVDRDLPPDVHQSLKNAEEELARHRAVVDQRKAWDREVMEGVRRGRYQVESGDGRRVDQGRNSDNSQDNVPPWLARQRDDALRTVDRYTRSDHLNAPAADRLDALVRASGTKIDPAGIGARYLAAVGLPAYNSAFGKILADPMHGHLRFSPEELDAVRVVSAVQTERALNEGTGSAGLFAIPFTLDPSIVISNTGALNPYRAISRIETIATKEWRGVSSDGVIAAYVPEATESTDASPVLAQPTIKAEQSRAFIPFSLELGQDWNGIQAELARLVSDAKDVLDATKFTVGSGTNEPTGVLTGLAVGQRIQTLTVAVYALGDPWLLKAAIPARFAASSTFVANPAIWDATYRFIGGNSAEPLQMPSREGPFLGRPKVEASAMVSTTTTGSKIILVGDFQHFCIVDRIGMGVELIPHLFGPTNRLPTGQRGLYAYWRAGSGVLAANAFRYLEVK